MTINKIDPLNQFEKQFLNVDPARLGRMIKEYVAESSHGGWDGFSRSDMTGIRRLLADMILYYNGAEPDHFDKTSNINPL